MTRLLRSEFPIFQEYERARGHRLAYLDSAATSQKPQCVIEAVNEYYRTRNANVHRAVHYLSAAATEAYENARFIVQKFLNAADAKECIFVKSATDAINLVANSFGNAFVQAGDEILISMMEHHSNMVPWQMLCQRTGALLRYIPMTSDGELDLTTLDSLLSPKTKLVALSHVSNALGTVHPIEKIIQKAHLKNIPVLIDGAQSAPHLPIDVQALDCDFFVFSGHKAYGPTGIGVLYGKTHWLERMPPYQGGGEMIQKVTLEGAVYKAHPCKFEAGTPAIAEVIALGAALSYLMEIGLENLYKQEKHLLDLTLEALNTVPGIKIVGNPKLRLGIISFLMDGIHAHDIGTLVNEKGVAIRTGHHCAMPIMDFLDIPATARISLGLYNSAEDIEQLMTALKFTQHIFKR